MSDELYIKLKEEAKKRNYPEYGGIQRVIYEEMTRLFCNKGGG